MQSDDCACPKHEEIRRERYRNSATPKNYKQKRRDSQPRRIAEERNDRNRGYLSDEITEIYSNCGSRGASSFASSHAYYDSQSTNSIRFEDRYYRPSSEYREQNVNSKSSPNKHDEVDSRCGRSSRLSSSSQEDAYYKTDSSSKSVESDGSSSSRSTNSESNKTIYYDVPRLTNMSLDEFISSSMFEILGFSETQHPLKLFDESNSLSSIKLSLDKIKSTEKSEASCDDLWVDLQKKIVPNIKLIFEDENCAKNKEEEGIIVVASLVERVPNLGGIARSCEIFGANELVLGNKKCTENKEFQSLSVTAEKWIKISEVKPQELPKYLIEMKEKGWNLIGLEQTARSLSLLETKFEKKTVLLLGNEKDGIPPHLIPILDTCVEIPQIGIIRSLNVHVTGAICIWEYAKQHSFS